MSNFFKTLEDKHRIPLNNQQRSAVTHGKGPALVLSGPGSGKTTVITARTAFLIEEYGISPKSILTVTFNKAAQLEMRNRYIRIFGEDGQAIPAFSTLHSFCYSIIRDYERRQGKQLKLIEGESDEEGASKQRILRDLYKEINEAPLNDDELETLINEIGLVKNRMVKDFKGLELQTKNFEAIFKSYEAYKKQYLLIDFDDMLVYSYSILQKCPDILAAYQSRYTYYQVDEGQDLSKVQFEILKLLVSSKENNVFFVADDDQSIYGFRGADPKGILTLKDTFKDLKVYKLEENFRSSRNIVELTSQFIKSNKERYDKAHTTRNREKYPPFLVGVEDEAEQCSFIVRTLKQHLTTDSHARIAVLYRNNLSSIPLVDALDRQGIPYNLRQNRVHFFQHWLVQDILAFFRFALNPCDSEAFSRIYLKMNRYISRVMMENALKYNPGIPVIEAIIKSNDLRPFQVNKLYELIKEFKSLARMSPFKALLYIEEDFKFFGSVKDYCDRMGLSMDALYGMFGILKTLALQCPTPSVFLARMEELEQKFQTPSAHNLHAECRVTLSTLHSSKGLEYDCVFMMDLTNHEIPGDRAIHQSTKEKKEEQLEEERRLFYVGMTRAKTWLYLVSPSVVNHQPVPRSTFVNEVAALLNQEITDALGEGMLIEHKKYGRGVIARIFNQGGRTLLEVDFKGRVRRLDLEICLESRIITLL